MSKRCTNQQYQRKKSKNWKKSKKAYCKGTPDLALVDLSHRVGK